MVYLRAIRAQIDLRLTSRLTKSHSDSTTRVSETRKVTFSYRGSVAQDRVPDPSEKKDLFFSRVKQVPETG